MVESFGLHAERTFQREIQSIPFETDADLEEVRKTCWPPMSLPQYGYP